MQVVEANSCSQSHPHFCYLCMWANDIEAEQEMKMDRWQQNTMDRVF